MTILSSSFTSSSSIDNTVSSHRLKFYNLFNIRSSQSKISNTSSIFDESNVSIDNNSLGNDSVNSISHCDLYHKFKTVNSFELSNNDNMYNQNYSSDNFNIDFDNSSLEFNINLKNFNSPQLKEDSSILLEFSPFESSSSIFLKNDYPSSRYKTILGKLKNFLNKPSSIELLHSEESEDEIYSPISMKIPINENISSSSINKKLDLSLFCEDEESIEPMSTIKFSKFADILIYNNNYHMSQNINLNSIISSPSLSTDHELSPINSISRKLSINKLKRNLSLSRKNSNSNIKSRKIQPILKNKINKNFNTEILNAKQNDSIEFESFLNNFENFELEKFKNEPILNNLRLLQLKNYYENQSSG